VAFRRVSKGEREVEGSQCKRGDWSVNRVTPLRAETGRGFASFFSGREAGLG
jgi:hypothetical protein